MRSRQFAHVVEDQRGARRHRGAAPYSRPLACAPPVKPNTIIFGAPRRGDARHAVLDDEAVGRGRAQPRAPRRGRCPARACRCATSAPRRCWARTARRSRRCAARRGCARANSTRRRRPARRASPPPRRCPRRLSVRARNRRAMSRASSLWKSAGSGAPSARSAISCIDCALTPRKSSRICASSHLRPRRAERRAACAPTRRLAVDEHAVAIEYDDFGPAFIRERSCDALYDRRLEQAGHASTASPPAAARSVVLQHLESARLLGVQRRDLAARPGSLTAAQPRHRRIAPRMSWRPAATAPSIAAPSSTGSLVSGAATRLPVASAMIWRTSALRAAPPLTTTVSNS